MAQPDATDQMIFQISVANPENDGTFSQEGLESVADQIHAFLHARTLGTWKRTGQPPKQMQIAVSLAFEDNGTQEELQNQPLPWWDMGDDGTDLLVVDGERRKWLPFDKRG